MEDRKPPATPPLARPPVSATRISSPSMSPPPPAIPPPDRPLRWPGVVRDLLEKGDIPPNTPGLAELEAELPRGWWRLVRDGETSKQRGWPLRHDVEIAYRAVARVPSLLAPQRSWLDEVRAWLEGPPDTAVFEDRGLFFSAMALGAMFAGVEISDAEALPLFRPDASEVERRAFVEGRQQAPAETAVCFLVEAARAAPGGWLSYYTYRGLSSGTSVYATWAIRLMLQAGHVTGAEVVAWARELARSSAG